MIAADPPGSACQNGVGVDGAGPRWGALRSSEPLALRRVRGRMAGALFVSGAVLGLLVIVMLPGWRTTGHAVLILLACGVGCGIGIYALAEKLGRLEICLLMIAGTLLIATGQAALLTGAANLAAGLLYVWVAVFAALYFELPWVVSQLAITALVQLIALPIGQVPAWPSQLVVTTGTCVVAALAVMVPAGRMRRDLNTDPLTGTMSRRGLEDMFDRAMIEAAQGDRPLAVALLDLDGFKRFNDVNGHPAGDRLLVEASAAWHACLRRRDRIARIGGDEFLVMLPDCESTAAEGIIQRMVAATPTAVTCSAGVTTTLGREEFGDVISRADAAMYRAKGDGGGRVRRSDTPQPSVGLYEV